MTLFRTGGTRSPGGGGSAGGTPTTRGPSARSRSGRGGPSRLRGRYGRRVGPGAAPVGRAWRGPRLGGQDARSLEAVGAEVVLPLGSTAPGVGRLLSERVAVLQALERVDRKSTRLNSSH